MCNLYGVIKSQKAIRDLVKAMRGVSGNAQTERQVRPLYPKHPETRSGWASNILVATYLRTTTPQPEPP
jgi:hypothetical protein